MPRIYKICPQQLWRQTGQDGVFPGSAADRADGFMHFSAPDQVAETARRHFAGQAGLLLIAVDADRLGAQLKWEPARGGARFPHLYGPLPLHAVVAVEPLALGADGHHVLPELAP